MKKDVMVICNIKEKSNHCLTLCLHGKPHIRETEKDACHKHHEYCNCHKTGKLQKVICIETKE